MQQHDIRIVLTAPLTPDGEIAEHVRAHGDGVRDIAFAVQDSAASWRETTSRGARSAMEPVELDGGEDGVLRRSAVWTYGDVRHSFVDRRDYHGAFAPGYRKVKKPAKAATGLSLLEVDHCVGNVGLGDMNRFVDYYRDVFGFAQLIHYDDKVIHTDYSALMSKVMTNGNGRVKFPINEPATGKKKSQIQEFLDWYHTPGVQHVALRTEDIVGTVRRLRDNGVEFLGMPHAYYESLGRPGGRRRRPDGRAGGAGDRGRPRRGGLPPPDLHAARSRTARRSSSRSSSATARGASAWATSRRCSRRSSSSRRGAGTSSEAPAPALDLPGDPNRVDGRLSGGAVGGRRARVVQEHDDPGLAVDVEEPDPPAIRRAVGIQALRLCEEIVPGARELRWELDVEALARVAGEHGVRDAGHLEVLAG